MKLNPPSRNAELAIANTSHLFYITDDASFVGRSAILFQSNTNNKMQVVSYNFCFLTTQEENYSTYDHELCSITLFFINMSFTSMAPNFR